MLKKNLRLMRLFQTSLLFLLVIRYTPVFADTTEFKIDFNAFMNETQIMSIDPDKMTLVWWLPNIFWEISMGNDPSVTSDEVQLLLDVFEPYTVVAVIDGVMGHFGGVTYSKEAAIRAKLAITTNNGETYYPIENDLLEPDIHNFVMMFTPVMKNMLGPMGENMQMYFFPATAADGTPLIEMYEEGKFEVSLGEEMFSWRLPLQSILPSITCPKCGESVSGAFNFCPWDGTPIRELKKSGR